MSDIKDVESVSYEALPSAEEDTKVQSVGNNAVSETLSALLNQPAVIATYGGNEHRGILEAVDGYMNVVLKDTTEYYMGRLEGSYKGSLFIKGATVLYISAA